jgi:hypothetical protein
MKTLSDPFNSYNYVSDTELEGQLPFFIILVLGEIFSSTFVSSKDERKIFTVNN